MSTTTNSSSLEYKGYIPMMALPEDRPVFEGYQENKDTFGCEDILLKILRDVVENKDLMALRALRCLNKYHYTILTDFFSQKIPLTDFFQRLTRSGDKIEIWDPEHFQHISALPILCDNSDWLKAVENEAGGVALYYEDQTMRQLVAWAQEFGVTVDVDDAILAEDDQIPLEKPQIRFFTNGIFKNSRNKTPQQLKTLVEEDHRCQMLTARQALCFALRMLQRSQGQTVVFGHNPWTYTYTSTPYGDPADGWFLIVGGCAPARVCVNSYGYGLENLGAGGQRKYSVIGH